ncbi:hypothetical protein MTO96_012917 [Rhipicephalus appendiculatus]
MLFKFCGDRDCPDWLLAEIGSLSKISSVKVKLLCAQVVNGLLHSKIDFDKVAKLTADSKFTEDDVKGVLMALEFILKNSTKFSSRRGDARERTHAARSTSGARGLFEQSLRGSLHRDTYRAERTKSQAVLARRSASVAPGLRARVKR